MSPLALALLVPGAWAATVRDLAHCPAHLVALGDQPLLDMTTVRAALNPLAAPAASTPGARRSESRTQHFAA